MTQGGPTRFHPHGDTQWYGKSVRAMPDFSFALSCLGFSQSQLPRPMPSGHFICMAQPTTEDTTWVV